MHIVGRSIQAPRYATDFLQIFKCPPPVVRGGCGSRNQCCGRGCRWGCADNQCKGVVGLHNMGALGRNLWLKPSVSILNMPLLNMPLCLRGANNEVYSIGYSFQFYFSHVGAISCTNVLCTSFHD